MSVFKGIMLSILVIAILIGISFASGWLDLKYMKFYEKGKANVQREVFKENKSYVEGMVSDLAKYNYEYNKETDEVAKKAILQLVREKYANFDLGLIENLSLQNFVRKAIGGM